MANLEDAIRTAFASGRLKGLTCWPCSAGFQANAKNGAGGWTCHVADNPVTALRLALGLETATDRHFQLTDASVLAKDRDIFA